MSYKSNIEKGLCGRCAKPKPAAKSLCSDCAEIARKRSEERRKKSQEQGLCSSCGARPKVEGKSKCEQCLSSGAASQRRKANERKRAGLCPSCGNPAMPGKVICEECSKRMTEVSAERYHERRAAGKCSYCDNDPIPGSTMCQYHIDQTAQQRLDLKLEVMNAYGGVKCSWCPETDIRYLEMDHIEGGGRQHLKRENLGSGGHELYSWLRRNNFPAGFRVLCHTCNHKSHQERCRSSGKQINQSTAPNDKEVECHSNPQ